MKAKILIVGGGVMGTSLAIKAAQKTNALTAPVVLCERAEIGAGSSGDSGAILRQFYADRLLAMMSRDSMREYAQFEARTGRSIGFTRPGVMTIAGPEQTEWHEQMRATVADLQETGIRLRIVESAELAQLVPGIHVRRGSVGVWEPDGSFVDPKQTLQAFAALARSYGTVTRLRVSVEHIHIENGRVVGARTSEGEVQADKVVLVGGPWTHRLLADCGVEIPLRVVRPENFFFNMPDAELELEEHPPRKSAGISFDIEDPSEKLHDASDVMAPRGLHPVIIDLEYDFYARCNPVTRRTRVGSASYDSSQAVDDPDAPVGEESAEGRAWAREVLERRMPEYEGRSDAGALTSWYTLTPDSQPVVGPIPDVEGLYVATGFSGHGFKLGPSIGEGLTQMLFDEPVTAFEPHFFDPMRFSGQEAWTGRFGF